MSHHPPFTPKERLGAVIMAAAVTGATLLLVGWAELQIRRSTRAWPPHVVKERSQK